MSAEKVFPIYTYYGDEDYFLDKVIEKALHWKGRSTTLLDGETTTSSELLSILQTRLFEEIPRVLVVDAAQKIKPDKLLKEWITAKTDTQLVLILIVRSAKLSESLSKGKVTEFKKLKTWDNNNEVVKWIESSAKKEGYSFEAGTAQLLYQLVGPDLWVLEGELKKLYLLAAADKHLASPLLKRCVAPQMQVQPWQVVEAALQKEPKKAMNLLHTLYKSNGEDTHVQVSYALQKQVEKLYIASSMLQACKAEDEIASALEMHPWRCKSFFMPIVRKHSKESVQQNMESIAKLDVYVKGGSTKKRTLVELTLLSVAA